MKLHTAIIRTLMLLMIVAAASIIPAYAAGNIVSKELIKGSSPLASWGIGDRLYLVTYSDGIKEYTIEKQDLFKGLFLAGTEEDTIQRVPLNTEAIFRVQLTGISSVMDGQNSHTHELEIKDGAGNIINTKRYAVASTNDLVTGYMSVGVMRNQGTYYFQLREYVYLGTSGRRAGADTKTLTVIVGDGINPTPAPAYTAQPTAQPAYTTQPTTQPTAAPGVTQTPITGGSPPKPVIIPPSVTKLLSDLWLSFKSIFGLSISGGQAVNIPAGKPYSTSISLAFNTPDSDYSDGSYQTIFAEWFIADSAQTVKYESGWQQLTIAPYGASASFTPQTDGKYYLIAVVVRQDYKWDAATQKWSNTETIETKEVQELNAKINAPAPAIGTQPATTSKGVLASLWGWILGFLGM